MKITWATKWSTFLIRIITRPLLLNRNYSIISPKSQNGLETKMDQEQCKMSLKLVNSTPKSFFFLSFLKSTNHLWKIVLATMSFKRYFKKVLKSKKRNFSKQSKEKSSIFHNILTDVELFKNLSSISKMKSIFKKIFLTKFTRTHFHL